jgi:quinol monooxygenase YgiN
VSFHFIIRFEPIAGKEEEFREELLRVIEPSQKESGCISMRAFESTGKEPRVFAVHSEWVDEAAFDCHAERPHTLRFIRVTEDLLTHPIKGLRSYLIAGGLGAASSLGKTVKERD